MPHADDIDEHGAIVDRIDDTIVTDADSPKVFRSAELLATGRTRIVLKGFDSRVNALDYGRGQRREFFPG